MYFIKPFLPLLLLALLSTTGSALSWKSAYELTIAKSLETLQTSAAATGKMASQYGPLAAAAAKKTVMEQLPKAASEAAIWTGNNTGLAGGMTAGVGGVIILAAPAAIVLPSLSTVGFGAGGVQAGSAAAAVHSTIGNVGLGSVFAMAQSATAGGAGMAVVAAVTQICGGAIAVAGAGLAYMKAKVSP